MNVFQYFSTHPPPKWVGGGRFCLFATLLIMAFNYCRNLHNACFHVCSLLFTYQWWLLSLSQPQNPVSPSSPTTSRNYALILVLLSSHSKAWITVYEGDKALCLSNVCEPVALTGFVIFAWLINRLQTSPSTCFQSVVRAFIILIQTRKKWDKKNLKK